MHKMHQDAPFTYIKIKYLLRRGITGVQAPPPLVRITPSPDSTLSRLSTTRQVSHISDGVYGATVVRTTRKIDSRRSLLFFKHNSFTEENTRLLAGPD